LGTLFTTLDDGGEGEGRRREDGIFSRLGRRRNWWPSLPFL
jgi:hypothetical protein